MDVRLAEELAKMPLMKGIYVTAQVATVCTATTAGLLCLRNVHYKQVAFIITDHESHGLDVLPAKGTLDPFAMRFVRISAKDPKKTLKVDLVVSLCAVVIPDGLAKNSGDAVDELWKKIDVKSVYVQRLKLTPCSTAPIEAKSISSNSRSVFSESDKSAALTKATDLPKNSKLQKTVEKAAQTAGGKRQSDSIFGENWDPNSSLTKSVDGQTEPNSIMTTTSTVQAERNGMQDVISFTDALGERGPTSGPANGPPTEIAKKIDAETQTDQIGGLNGGGKLMSKTTIALIAVGMAVVICLFITFAVK